MRETRRSLILHVPAALRAVSRKGALRPLRVQLGVAVVIAAIAATTSHDARAQCAEKQFQNYTGGGQLACPCFVANEQVGAIFTLPANDYPVEILKVGIGWGSGFGGSGNTLEEAIHIYNGGLPNPGSPIFTLPGPVLTDGFINEFNLESYPGEIAVASGPITVTLEFLVDNVNDFFAGTVVNDGNGCQGGKNIIYAIPGGWINGCSGGVSGDWVFYIKYRSLKVTGGANPVRTFFSNPPLAQTTCDTVYVVNSGCDDLVIESITGCGAAPFSVDTTLTSHSVPPAGSTPILVCVTPTGAVTDSCVVTVKSNASNDPITFSVVIDALTAVDYPATNGFAIVGVVPNPFNPATSIRFTLPQTLPVTADVWTVTGAKVRTLANGTTFSAGVHALRWDGRNTDGERVASGVYLFRVTTPLGKRVARMVLVQ
jgi:FlgD Ig-like domain